MPSRDKLVLWNRVQQVFGLPKKIKKKYYPFQSSSLSQSAGNPIAEISIQG
jgi:hypothetical protein